MALLGRGAAAIWHNVAPEAEADYNHWHCFEHMPERLAIPGFLRGRRYVAVEAERKYFHFYETESLAVLTSPAYLARLNAPTPWTRAVGPSIRDNNRTLAEVELSRGAGVGGAVLTARLTLAADAGPRLAAALATGLMPTLMRRPGVLGAHLLRGDRDASGTGSAEKAMRERADEVADRVLLVEGIEAEPLRAARTAELADAALASHGILSAAVGLYRLHYALAHGEAPPI